MVTHIVFFGLKDQAEGHSKQENALIIKQHLESLKGDIDYLRHIEVGINLPNAPKTDHDVALLCQFDSWEDLNSYAVHPKHVAVLEYIKRVMTKRSAVDYEQ